MTSLNINELSFSYTKNTVLNNISFDFTVGNIFSILGLNGSGKSTFIKLIVGLLEPQKGGIYIDNENLSKLSYIKRAKSIAYVPQMITNNSNILVQDYVMFSYYNRMKLFQNPSKEIEEKGMAILNEFTISHLSKKTMSNLSGGEKQLVLIASAVLQDTPIIVLDEPTSALDIKNQFTVISALTKLQEAGKTIILSTHNPNHCLHLGGEVLLLKDKKIASSGSAEEIIKVEILKTVYGENLVYTKSLEGLNEITFFKH